MNMQISKIDSAFISKTIGLIRKNNPNFSWSDTQIKECFYAENNIVFGLFDEKLLVGISFLSFIFDEAELLYITLDKAYRGKGVASKLLLGSIEFLKKKNIAKIFLEVDANNISAINLYNKLDFQQISIRKKYYKCPDGSYNDALIYQKNV